jgi:hypothetical protein
MRKKLTELSIARLAAPERGYDWYPDSLLLAFGLRVYPTGNRVWGSPGAGMAPSTRPFARTANGLKWAWRRRANRLG